MKKNKAAPLEAREPVVFEYREDLNPKDRYGLEKPSVHEIPPSALFHLGQAMKIGKTKYGLVNWRDKKVIGSIYFDAMQRHAWAWQDGEEIAFDEKTGLQAHHLAHVMACCCILLDAMECKQLVDDRGTKGPLPDLLRRLTQERPGKK